MSEELANRAVLSFDTSFLECPICFKCYAEVDPTTFPCGHSCCMIDAKKLKKCCLCNAFIPPPNAHSISISLRDVAHSLLPWNSQTGKFPKGNVEVEDKTGVYYDSRNQTNMMVRVLI